MIEIRKYIVSCRGAIKDENVKKQKDFLELEHQKSRKNKNVDISLTKFVTDVYRLGNRQKDLLEMAGYIFAADRKTYRGFLYSVEYHSWSREFHFHFKVRDYEFWNRQEIKDLLSEALCFMTGDLKYEFTFYRAEPDFPTNIFDNENFVLEGKKDLSVVLFSGGIDSLAGTLERIEKSTDELCLVSHQSGVPSVKRTQKQLYEELNRLYPNRCKHYKFRCGLSKKKAVDETQRTRPFLYCSMAFAIAVTHSKNSIYVYENGITSINLPETQDLINGRSSRTTHPKTIGLLEKLFTEINGKEFKIQHPFLFSTKTDVVNILKKYNGLKLLDSSVSCSRTFKKPPSTTHCGKCLQCVDRRFAVYSAEVERFDENGIYKYDFLTKPIKEPYTKKVLVEYIRIAQEFREKDADWLYMNKTSEMFELEEYLEGDGLEEKIGKIFQLYQRHSDQIENAIEHMSKIHDKPFLRTHPDSFFRLIIEPRIYQQPEEQTDEVEKKKEVEQQLDSNKKNKISVEELVKLYIGICKKLKLTEPTIDQLYDTTEIQKSVWGRDLKKSTFWHILKDEVDHSINQAKKQETRDFWINVKVDAEHKYANLTVKEYKQKEKNIDDLHKKKQRSF